MQNGLKVIAFLSYAALGLVSSCLSAPAPRKAACEIEWVVLGTAQDAGAPQIGNAADPGWRNPSLRRLATSAALIDHDTNKTYLFEATPDLTEQLNRLDRVRAPSAAPLGLDGVFITHAHIGHYAGLMYAGREAAGASKLDVYAMPRLSEFLTKNGPWSQLVALGNISLLPLRDGEATALTGGVSVTPLRVPHRDEFSETVGFVVRTPQKSLLFLPDIDAWDRWKTEHGKDFRQELFGVDYAFVDATFYDDHELPGRDMREIPHPRVTETMALLADQPANIRARVQFIHVNHTNPIRFENSPESRGVVAAGFGIAREGQRYCLAAKS